MSCLVCTSFTTNSAATACRAFAAAVESNSTVGRILAARVEGDLPDDHDLLFAAPEDGSGLFGELDAEAERIDGGDLMATLSVTRAEIDARPGLLGSFYGGSSAGEIALICDQNHVGGLVYRVEARSAGSVDTTHGPSQVLAWAAAAARRIGAANAVIDAAREPAPVGSFVDEEEAAV